MGGVRTVRGQSPGTQSGDAFWLARAELGTRQGIVRPLLFYDAGWAGARNRWGGTRPQQGAGLGFGLLDGLLRVDIARGIYPAKRWRMDFYLDGVL
jgi:hemolysin activation/secretion protein